MTDCTSNTHYLVDTGADFSVLPPSRSEKQHISPFTLQSLNKSSIATYGEKSMSIDIGLRRTFRRIFCFPADLANQVLGVEFLAYFNLKVHVPQRTHIDTATS